MKNTDIPQIRAWFDAYSQSFYNGDPAVDENIRLKIEHSLRVYDIMEEIADSSGMEGRDRLIALGCALLHDCGRFEQFSRYRTFSDPQSVDHGKLGAEILETQEVLSGLSDEASLIIMEAVRHHNAKELPQDMNPATRHFTELTRDADKIDILGIFCDYYSNPDPGKDRVIVHNLPVGEDVSYEVYREFMAGGNISYLNLQSDTDFIVFLCGWVWGINTAEAFEILQKRGYMLRLLEFLPDTDRCRAVKDYFYSFMKRKQRDVTLNWTELSREQLLDCRIFSLYSSVREAHDGRRSSVYMLKAPDWVTIVPLLEKDGEKYFVMVRQYRHGAMKITMEFPAGTLEPGEDAKEAALRELLEETGCRAASAEFLGRVNPNPAFLTNTFTAYLATGLEETGIQNLDENEYVDYELVPVSRVIREMGTGEYCNGTMLMALMFYLRKTGYGDIGN